MSYIGAEPTTAAFPFDQFSGTGAATSFTLTYAPASATSILVAISGVTQNPNLYSVIGTTLTFSPAPPAGTNNISVLYLGLPVIGSTSPGNTAFLSATDLTATAGQTVFASAGSYTPGFVQVYRNGARLGNADFTATNGTTITLANAAAAGDLVTIEYYTLTSLTNALPLTGGTVTGSTTFNTGVNLAAVSGNVGIGTSSPASKLHVVGSFRQTGATAPFEWTVNSGGFDFYKLNAVGYADNIFVANSAGNVGIGTSSPPYRLSVTPPNVTLTGAGIDLFRSGSLTSNIGGVLNFRPTLGQTASDLFNLSICAYDHSGDQNTDGLSINGYDGVSFSTGSNSRQERARINSSGHLLVGVTSDAMPNAGFALQPAEGNLKFRCGNANSYTQFYNQSNTQVGGITTNGTTVSYVTSSDYRLKEAIAPMTGALAKVALLKPCTYKWKVDGSDGQGFIAHELAEVCPHAVIGKKDAVDADGNPQYQGIDTSFLVATLTAAIQEQQTLITALTARITALESK